MLEAGGLRVLGVGSSAAALRPDPPEPALVDPEVMGTEADDPETIDDEPEVEEGGPVETTGEPLDEDDPFAETQVTERPVVAPAPAVAKKPSSVVTAVSKLSGSTMALERRPSRTPSTAPAPTSDNYLDDPEEERRYRVRAVLTFAAMLALFIFLRWALGGMGEAIGQLWSNFQENLKI